VAFKKVPAWHRKLHGIPSIGSSKSTPPMQTAGGFQKYVSDRILFALQEEKEVPMFDFVHSHGTDVVRS
jgi:hypothetical protein